MSRNKVGKVKTAPKKITKKIAVEVEWTQTYKEIHAMCEKAGTNITDLARAINTGRDFFEKLKHRESQAVIIISKAKAYLAKRIK